MTLPAIGPQKPQELPDPVYPESQVTLPSPATIVKPPKTEQPSSFDISMDDIISEANKFKPFAPTTSPPVPIPESTPALTAPNLGRYTPPQADDTQTASGATPFEDFALPYKNYANQLFEAQQQKIELQTEDTAEQLSQKLYGQGVSGGGITSENVSQALENVTAQLAPYGAELAAKTSLEAMNAYLDSLTAEGYTAFGTPTLEREQMDQIQDNVEWEQMFKGMVFNADMTQQEWVNGFEERGFTAEQANIKWDQLMEAASVAYDKEIDQWENDFRLAEFEAGEKDAAFTRKIEAMEFESLNAFRIFEMSMSEVHFESDEQQRVIDSALKIKEHEVYVQDIKFKQDVITKEFDNQETATAYTKANNTLFQVLDGSLGSEALTDDVLMDAGLPPGFKDYFTVDEQTLKAEAADYGLTVDQVKEMKTNIGTAMMEDITENPNRWAGIETEEDERNAVVDVYIDKSIERDEPVNYADLNKILRAKGYEEITEETVTEKIGDSAKKNYTEFSKEDMDDIFNEATSKNKKFKQILKDYNLSTKRDFFGSEYVSKSTENRNSFRELYDSDPSFRSRVNTYLGGAL